MNRRFLLVLLPAVIGTVAFFRKLCFTDKKSGGLHRFHGALVPNHDGNNRIGEFNELGDWWNMEGFSAMTTTQQTQSSSSGNINNSIRRDLLSPPFSNMDECLEAGLPLAFCSCVVRDGNSPAYCMACGNALVQSQFDISNTARFSEWLVEDSVLQLAQTGTYKGVAAITEYVNYIYSIFYLESTVIGSPIVKFIPNENFGTAADDNNVCIVSLAYNIKRILNPDFYQFPCIKGTVGTTLYFNVSSTRENAVIDVVEANVWYPHKYIGAVFEGMTQDAVVDWLCDTISSYCSSTWVFNNFDNNDNKCTANYKDLPWTEGDLHHIDGSSLGCKVLHATFVELNANHCAHTSFKKQIDPNGVIKCQISHGTLPEDIFTNEMLTFFAQVGETVFGYGPDLMDKNPSTACS